MLPQATAGEAMGLSAADVAQIAADRRLQVSRCCCCSWQEPSQP
jgi:hypothetical protein